jgi:SGNH hydrolase-like domain, acetyltransferase AlgX
VRRLLQIGARFGGRAHKRGYRRLALALAGVCAIVAAGEILLRAYGGLLPEEAALRLFWREIEDRGGLKAVPHEEVAYLMPASVEDEIRAGGMAFTYRTDQHGFRNPSPWPPRADVVILGDSLAFGFGVDDHQSWVSRLGEQLPDLEIVNLGILAAAPQQYLLAYETFGARLKPERVVVALYPPNALGAVHVFDDWMAAGKPERLDLWRAQRARSGPLAEIKRALMRSHLITGLYFGAKEIGAPVRGRTLRFQDGGRVRVAPAEIGMAPFARAGHPWFERVIEILLELRAAAARDGSEFLVALFPSKWEALEPLLEGPVPELTAPFARRFDELGVPYLDLTGILSERAARGERLFLEVDIHPNPEGYRLIAEVIADHLDGQLVTESGLGGCALHSARSAGGRHGTACRRSGDERG